MAGSDEGVPSTRSVTTCPRQEETNLEEEKEKKQEKQEESEESGGRGQEKTSLATIILNCLLYIQPSPGTLSFPSYFSLS